MVTDLPRIVHSSLGLTCIDSVLCARCLQQVYPHGAARLLFLLRVLRAVLFVGRLVSFKKAGKEIRTSGVKGVRIRPRPAGENVSFALCRPQLRGNKLVLYP